MIATRPEIDVKIDRWRSLLENYEPQHGAYEEMDKQFTWALPQVDALAEIFGEFRRRAKVKANWKTNFTYSAWSEYVRTDFKTTKTKCSFNLNFGMGKIWLSSYMRGGQYLRNMTDDFWIELAHLCEETPLKWETNNSHEGTKINRDLYKHEKSVFFCILRNYILGAQSDEWENIGSFKVEWPIDADWHKMLDEGAIALRRIFKLNYLLWRWHYQVVFRNLTKDAAKHGYDVKEMMGRLFSEDEKDDVE